MAAVVVAFLTLRLTGSDDDAGRAVEAPTASETPSTSPTSPAPESPSSRPTRRAVERTGRIPTGLDADDIDVSARVVPIASVGTTLTPPSDVHEIGWWSDGARAGASSGSVLLTGHTVHTGGGVFDDLGDLDRGETVTVWSSGRPIHYRVDTVRYLTKAQLSSAAPTLFDPTGPPQLVLVTCESWDGSEYDGNTVVVATPV